MAKPMPEEPPITSTWMVCSNVSMATFLLQQRRGVRVIENQHLRQRT
ncbi:hypothetical protein A225_3780 [Klebsiella michiganensis E718]|nr:hypothetical protein A225_3780 [Klebsiella michiganensis E718]